MDCILKNVKYSRLKGSEIDHRSFEFNYDEPPWGNVSFKNYEAYRHNCTENNYIVRKMFHTCSKGGELMSSQHPVSRHVNRDSGLDLFLSLTLYTHTHNDIYIYI